MSIRERERDEELLWTRRRSISACSIKLVDEERMLVAEELMLIDEELMLVAPHLLA
jgi:hypothetical protein